MCGYGPSDDQGNHSGRLPDNADLVLPAEWERGRDFQYCPSCGRVEQLAIHCNHLNCPCGASYCRVDIVDSGRV